MTVEGDNHPINEPHDGELAATTHGDPLGGDPGDPADPTDPGYGGEPGDLDADGAEAAAPPPASKVVAAVLVSIVVVLLGIALWSYIFVEREREYVGVSVPIGLAVGWIMRVVSGRSSMPVRIVAVLLTALGCVGGTMVSAAAYEAGPYRVGFMDRLSDIAPDTMERMTTRPGLTYGIFAIALLLAYLAAAPQKPPKSKQPAPAPVADSADDAPPPQLPAD